MKKRNRNILFSLIALALFTGCGGGSGSTTTDKDKDKDENKIPDNSNIKLKNVSEYVSRYKESRTTPSAYNIGNSQSTKVNEEALVPSMCYTKHDQQHNPCYVCHQDNILDGRATKIDDGVLQNEYIFSDFAQTNHWDNLFQDRTEKINKISDENILSYINEDNYSDLIEDLKSNDFTGYIPDLENFHKGAEAFAADGFAKDGSGWVAFNYKPLPSTFWPVNGSTDDVLIRLHKDFRQNNAGEMSSDVYRFNLAIVEAAIKNKKEISVNSLDENKIGIDLNKDGKLGVVDSIQRPEYYVGKASDIPVETFLYPLFTEFLHSVRYVGVKEDGEIYNAPRMKELRYMIKTRSYHDAINPMNKTYLSILYDDEWQEKFEGNNVPTFNSLGEKGLDNKMGWWLQAFIEGANGDLRPQTYEETFFCMGCHTNLGSTIDQVFSFARKVEGKEGWGYIDLKKMIDVPNVGETEGEILTYLKRVGGGSEFRAKNNVHSKFYDNGVLNEQKVKSAKSIYELITPTRESALKMNKSYKVLVESQSFVHGRDGNDKPVENVFKNVDDNTPTLPKDKQYKWDMRLDWSKQ